MHFVLSYDLGADGTRRAEIEEKIQTIINKYRNVKRLTTFYIIHVGNSLEWENIRSQLTNLSVEIPERLHFIMTPLMDGGKYNGILLEGQWEEVNAITNMD